MLIKKRKPNLRFTDFKEDWVFKKLGDVGALISGLTYSPKDIGSNGVLVLRSSNVQKGVLVFDDNVYVNSVKYNPVFENDILICVRNGSKNLIGKNALITKEAEGVAFGAFMTVFRSDLNRFVFQLLATNSYFRIIYQNLGATINSINGSDLKKFIFFFPKEKQEQQKLVNFLTAIDNHIQTLEKKKTLLEQYKKGVLQKIFKQELRFKDDTSTSLSACDGKEFADWEKRRFSDVLFEHKLKSTGKEKVHSVSVHKGVINQIEHLGRSFSAKNTDHYSRALPNDIIYTKSPTGDFPLGIIKQNHIKKDVIISPLYGVFTPETKELGYILHVYFESPINTSNYLSSIIQKGAKNTINITNNTFLSKKMLLPVSKEEQTKIANFLSAIDKNIELITKKIEHTKTYKKGLLQQMFV
jgi:type I restriction enzyme S subunit